MPRRSVASPDTARDLVRRENPVYVCGGTENKFYRYETFCIFASSNIYKTYNNEK